VSGLAALDEAGVAAACVGAMSARIGDPASTYSDGVVSAVNETARRRGVAVGQPAAEAARRMLQGGR
jgi:nucleotidyltransferase/DNA polymerase involved in DNA repair